jgi:uncharacterized membrane protein
MQPAQPTAAGDPQWGYPSRGESRWPATLAVLLSIALYLRLPDRLTAGPHFIVPALELALLVPLSIANPTKLTRESRDMRVVSLALIALVNLANATSLVRLIGLLLKGGDTNGRQLIDAGVGVWVTLVIVFSLWYWELDRGGPQARAYHDHGPPDFLFPQMDVPGVVRGPWAPTYIDYLFLSLTNCMAFSPTDTLPLTPRAKVVMGTQSLASIATVAIVGARAINILR